MLTGAIIDSREPQSILNLKFGGVPTMRLQLETGDLWASTDDGEMLVIERKSPSDLLGSIKDGRLFNQCAAMREKSKWAYVIVTGALAHTLDGHVITDNRTTGWRYDDVQGALLTVQELGVSLIHCQSDSHYEQTVMRLAKRDRKTTKPIEPRTQAHILTDAEKILMSLPGIGLERAGLLLGEFETAAHALAWLTWIENFRHDVARIGNGTKHRIRTALGLKPEEWLTVFYPEAAEYAARNAAAAHEPEEVGASVLGVQQQDAVPA